MKTATITCANGHTWSTPINGTESEIRKYFIGKWFNTASYPDEIMSKAVKCEVKELQ